MHPPSQFSLPAIIPTKMSLPLLLFSLFSLLSLPIWTSSSSSPPMSSTQELNTINPHLPNPKSLLSSKKFEGSSDLIHLKYHMGPVLSSSPIKLYLIWYGHWAPQKQLLIRDFLLSISPSSAAGPTVSAWWKTVTLYSDQTNSHVSPTLLLTGEYPDRNYSQGNHLTRLSMQRVVSHALQTAPFPTDHRNGAYLILTSPDVTVQDFCRAACGFHYFTFPSIASATLPYAWVGDSSSQCPEVCAYPFAVPGYMGAAAAAAKLQPPNGVVGVDGMVSVIGHELAEMATNPLVNAWYGGEDPIAPNEIGDLCEGVYGSGGGGGYMGQVMRDGEGRTFNLYGENGRKFLVQWVWSPLLKACSGPNALD